MHRFEQLIEEHQTKENKSKDYDFYEDIKTPPPLVAFGKAPKGPNTIKHLIKALSSNSQKIIESTKLITENE